MGAEVEGVDRLHFPSEVRDKSFERDEGRVGHLQSSWIFRAVVVRVRRETVRDSRDHSGSPLPACLCPLSPILAVQESEHRKHVSSWGCRIVLLERGLWWASLWLS